MAPRRKSEERRAKSVDNLRYLSATRNDFIKVNNCLESKEPLGMRVINGGAVAFWKPQIRFSKQPIKNVRVWESPRRTNRHIDRDVILLGIAEKHFGHFLADSLSRAWIALDSKYKNAEYVVVSEKELAPFAADLYKLAGIKNLTVVDKKTSFRSITIPDSSFNYPTRFFHKKFTDTFTAIANAVPAKTGGPKKIYFSRLELPENPTLGEEQIEKIFKGNGYTVIPSIQTMTIADQIAMSRGATHIAGIEGTAIHQSLFMPDGGHVICVHRYNAVMPMQILIDKLKGLDTTYIDASRDPYSKKKNESPITIVGINNDMRAFLDDNKFKYKIDVGAEKHNMEMFMNVWRASHRRIPKWISKLIVAIMPTRNLRKNMRRKLGLSFAGMTRDDIEKMI